MNHLITLLFCSLILFPQFIISQNIHDHDSNDEIIQCGFITTNPNVMENANNFERWMNDKKVHLNSRDEDQVINIPVIFHILHQGQDIGMGYNLSEAQINTQIEQVNNDLRKMIGTSGYNTFSEGADTKIQLVPAIYDEEYNELVEAGINRINTIATGLGSGSFSKSYMNNTIKQETQWNPDLYLNIWVAPLSAGLLGFGQFPEASGLDGVITDGTASTDGIVILYKTVGSTDSPNLLSTGGYANYNQGRTLTHELGHWLGLRHTWGDGGCTTDDYCLDTPPAGSANYNCSDAVSTCGHNDMVENYMDYTYDTCKSVFTLDQKIRMRTVMMNSPRRLSLITSDRAGSGPVLPVELLDYDVRLAAYKAINIWSTATETNNSHFIISKSSDGIHFEDISTIEGIGNSSGVTFYEFTDYELFEGDNYYKLTQVDMDGETTELGIRVITYFEDTNISYGKNLNISLAPNPAQDYINLDFFSDSGMDAIIQIYDLQGRILQTYEKEIYEGESQMNVDISFLETGMYIVRIISGDKEQIIKRFNKVLG